MPRAQDIWFSHLQSATHYNQWIFSHVQPHLSGRTLEVGCGNGNFSTLIAQNCSELLAVDLDDTYTQQTQARLKGYEHAQALTMDATKMDCAQAFDTIIMLDVLEHIEDDVSVLSRLREQLTPTGKLIVKVPAIEALYNSLDKAVGHHRRYSATALSNVIAQANFSPPMLQYFNMAGIFGWWLNGALGKVTPPGEQVGWFDKCVPLFQVVESVVPCPTGLSLFAIATKAPPA